MSVQDGLQINNPFAGRGADPSEGPSESRGGGGGGRGFSGALSVGASLVPGGGVLSLVARGASALFGGGVDPRQEQMDQMWQMQAESQMFNMEYMALQQSAQNENRHFTAMSNLLKARHDTAKSAISNIRV